MNINEDQIDLRPYIVTLLKYKWLIILVGVGFALFALIYTILQPRQYASTATLLLTRSRPVLELADKFPTVTEPVDSRSTMEALLTIANSDAVIQQTIQVLDDSLPSNYRSIEGRHPNTLHTLRAIRAAGLLPSADAAGLDEHNRFLRRVSGNLRLFGVRPSDTIDVASPVPSRLARALEYPSRKDFLEDYRRRTAWVRALPDRVVRP